MTGRTTQDTAALAMIGIVALFIGGSMVALIVGAFEGLPGGENIWAGLFSLCTALLGAVGGWIGGTAATTRKLNGNGKPPEA